MEKEKSSKRSYLSTKAFQNVSILILTAVQISVYHVIAGVVDFCLTISATCLSRSLSVGLGALYKQVKLEIRLNGIQNTDLKA
jgi:hypothetical protein